MHTRIQELPNDPLNYGLYLPASSIGKLGKFLNDSLLLSFYVLEGNVPRLEVGGPYVQAQGLGLGLGRASRTGSGVRARARARQCFMSQA